MKEYVVPVFYYVKAESTKQAQDAVYSTLEQHEYDQDPEEAGYFAAVCIGNIDEVYPAE
jgi:hypothetical protein